MFEKADKILKMCQYASIDLSLTDQENICFKPYSGKKVKRTLAIEKLLKAIKENKEEIVLYFKLGLDKIERDGNWVLTPGLTWVNTQKVPGVISEALRLFGGTIDGGNYDYSNL